MNPGGGDIVIPRKLNAEDIRKIIYIVRSDWPCLRVESGHSEELSSYDTWYNPILKAHGKWFHEPLKEFFIFKNQWAKKEWNSLGATPWNENMMVHFIQEENQLTIVVPVGLPFRSRDPSQVNRIVRNIVHSFLTREERKVWDVHKQ